MSNYLQTALLDAVLIGTPYTPPTVLWIALYSSNPTAADTGTEVVPSGGFDYERQLGAFGASSLGVALSTNVPTWINMPTVLVSHLGLRDDPTDGDHLLLYGALVVPRNVIGGDNLDFQVGEIQATLV